MPTLTKVKTNGVAKKDKHNPAKVVESMKEAKKANINVSLDERLKRFEELRGLNNKHDSINVTLTHLQKFNFSQNDSCSLVLQDQAGKQFSTTNTNLITMLSNNLQGQLERKKKELEDDILAFEF